MNIVKFKDIILTPQESSLTESQCELFNKKFKGRYVYCINWLFCVPIEDVSTTEYILASTVLTRESSLPEGALLWEQLVSYADAEETDRVNSVVAYLAANKYAADSDITIDELKVFRRWLAEYLLMFDQEDGKQQYKLYDEDTTHMLQYYANDMYDTVIKYLSVFGRQDIKLTPVVSACSCNGIGSMGAVVTSKVQNNVLGTSQCGCNTGLITGNAALTTCDPIGIYRKNIYYKMTEVFSNMDFWKQFSKVFLTDFKKYIDGIVAHDFPLHTSTFVSMFADCGCLSEADAEQKKNMAILRDLSKSLQYIIDDEINSHKNFIANSLSWWSTTLYEQMFWN